MEPERYAHSKNKSPESKAPVALNPDLSGIYRGGAVCVLIEGGTRNRARSTGRL
jgi:hypothetical protein